MATPDLHTILMRAHQAADYLQSNQKPSKEDNLDDIYTTMQRKEAKEKEMKENLSNRKPSKPTKLPVINRNAMGEYVPPEGGKPLTWLGDKSPGPTAYFPKIDMVKPCGPHYSLYGRTKRPRVSNYKASPGDRDISVDAVYPEEKAVLMKGRNFPPTPANRSDNYEANPLTYNVQTHNVGKDGGKVTIKGGYQKQVTMGPPDPAVAPANTKGFFSPGPVHRPNSALLGKGKKWTFGLNIPVRGDTDKKPGPADYTIPDPDTGPKPTFAGTLPGVDHEFQLEQSKKPGPIYDIPTTVGKCPGKSITSRPQMYVKDWVPAPDVYLIKRNSLKPQGAHITYRPFTPPEKPYPAPNSYYIQDFISEGKTAANRIRPTYPTAMHFPEILHKDKINTPHAYQGILMKSNKPNFSMGRLIKSAKDESPGPAKYKINKRPEVRSTPAYSLRSRPADLKKDETPGPAAYYPDAQRNKVAFSIAKKTKPPNEFVGPGPNQYEPLPGATRKAPVSKVGTSLRSRHSHWVYSGFPKQTTLVK